MKVRLRYRPCQLEERATCVAIALLHLFFRKFLNEGSSVGDAKTIRVLKDAIVSELGYLPSQIVDKTLTDPVTAWTTGGQPVRESSN